MSVFNLLDHVAVLHLKVLVELVVRTFPPVVAPEVEAGIAADSLLEHCEVAAGYLKLG